MNRLLESAGEKGQKEVILPKDVQIEIDLGESDNKTEE